MEQRDGARFEETDFVEIDDTEWCKFKSAYDKHKSDTERRECKQVDDKPLV